MALDGVYLSRIRYEITEAALGSRIDKIAQPSREELVITLRWKGGSGKLLLSASADNARVHFTQTSPENPKSPPMFCMLMRKHLGSGKLVGVRQEGLDRILFLDFETINELGDTVVLTLACEIMGRHSNIILIDPNGRIIDAMKRIDFEMSSVRQVLPGMQYALPPAQDKLNPFDTQPEEIVRRLCSGRDIPLSKALLEAVQGLSPIICRELSELCFHGLDPVISEIPVARWDRVNGVLAEFLQTVRSFAGTPTIVSDPATGRPKDMAFLPITQYGESMDCKTYPTFSALLDVFFGERARMGRIHQRSHDLHKLLSNTLERVVRRTAAQREELKECAQREQLKIFGDLISANLYTLQKGDKTARVQNFYEEDCPEVQIPLDPMLTPVQNSQKYYQEYRKADTAEKMLIQLISAGEEEIIYLQSVMDELERAISEADLNAIRGELAQGGYARRAPGKGRMKEEKLSPIRYRSTDGFLILCGRNNVQNDRLTLKESRNYDMWMHTQKIPGSHVIVVADGKEIPNSTLEQAAIIAATNSKARESSKVPVDYTIVKNVKKPVGAKPGMVIYETYQTAIVDPNVELTESLKIQ